jgi:hypothetical protein
LRQKNHELNLVWQNWSLTGLHHQRAEVNTRSLLNTKLQLIPERIIFLLTSDSFNHPNVEKIPSSSEVFAIEIAL